MAPLVVAGASEAVSVGCLVGLWKGKDRLPAKVGWTVVLLIPVMGPILYGGLHRVPEPWRDRDPTTGPNTNEADPTGHDL